MNNESRPGGTRLGSCNSARSPETAAQVAGVSLRVLVGILNSLSQSLHLQLFSFVKLLFSVARLLALADCCIVCVLCK